MSTRRLALLLAITAVLSASAFAQVYEATSKAATTMFLLRLQRQEGRSAMCAVVYPDHRAHYEIQTGFGSQVFEGPLSAESAAQVDGLLPPLAGIDPRAIVHKTQLNEIDIVVVNVMTPRGLRNLQFSDPSARKPFKAAMDPALKWLSSARKGLPTVPESRKNNCMPESGAATPAPKTEPPLMSKAQAQALARFMLVRASNFRADDGVVHESCAVIAPSGRYHYETHSVSQQNSLSSAKVFEGTVDSSELARLSEILADPALRDSTHNPDPSNGVRARDSETFELNIPREDHLQQLRFFSNTGVAYQAPNAMLQVTDTDTKLTAPIRAWLKSSIEKRKGVSPLAETKPTHCSVPF